MNLTFERETGRKRDSNVKFAPLEGKVALVTGGASGIGRAIVKRFVADGARAMIADIDAPAGKALAAELGDNATFQPLDVSNGEQWAAAFDRIASEFGALTTLVNNAGRSFRGSIADATEADWRRTMDINGLGTFLGCKGGVNAMRERGGSIINIASARGQRASSGQAAYCASKALVINLTESTALYCGEQGLPIRCNAICPGVIDTQALNKTIDAYGGGAGAKQRLAAMQVLGRLGRPEEVAAMAAFLASDEASFVTGAALNVDGGFRIRD